jgi:FkbM family methyltransferase
MKNVNGWWLIDGELDDGYSKFTKEKCDWQGEGFVNFCVENVKETVVALDIGACYGAMSYAFSHLFETVHAFEINPDFIEPLKKNLEGCDNVIIHNVGIGIETGLIDFSAKDAGGLSRTLPEGNFSAEIFYRSNYGRYERKHYPDFETRKLPIKKLDDCEFERIDLIKIDVEHAEAFTIYGAMETIKKHKPVIICESGIRQYKDVINFLLIDVLGYERRRSRRFDHKYVHPENSIN